MKRWLVCLMGLGVVPGPNAHAQSDKPLQLASREPAFYAIVGSHLERAEARNVAALREHLALHLRHATIAEALKAIEAQTALRFAFKPSILPSGAMVSLDASDITVAAALTQILQDADVDVEIAPYGLASIVARQRHADHSIEQSGTISGRVIDAKTHKPISYATVSVQTIGRTGTANDSGSYRITNVPAGSYVVVARRLGYLVSQQSVTVSDEQVTTANFDLVMSASQLDQVVVTGSVIPTEVRAMPTPITVIGDSAIAQQQPHTISELFRQYVPTGVSWDVPQAPTTTFLAGRGASDLVTGGSMKIIIDGVETNSPGSSPIDPESIDRIEVIRGPEASAIYGSGAIDGVIQVFTKRGDGTKSLQVNLEAAAADVQTPYAGFRGVLRQTYDGNVRGGTPDATYTIGGGYSHTDNYIPDGEYSAMSAPSVYGAIHYSHGIAAVDLSARRYENNDPTVMNPQLFNVGLPSFAKPVYTSDRNVNQTVGATLTIQPVSWWHTAFIAGFDETSSDFIQRRARLTTPADTELQVDNSTGSKTSLALNTSITGRLAETVNGTFTVGVDHWTAPYFNAGSGAVFNVVGGIQTDSEAPISATRYITTNSGVFAQGQLGFYDALYLTAGLRADWNSDWGDSVGVPVSPRVGASYLHGIGIGTVKLRLSYGSALLPPSAGEKSGLVLSYGVVLANPHLGPEHQHGGDGGIDFDFGSHASFSATYYNQTAVNLIQNVTFPNANVYTVQNENVGTIRNTGVEFETNVNFWSVSLHGMYGYSRSAVDKLEPDYQGDFRIGDQVQDFPKHTAGASLAVAAWHGLLLTAGLTYVGSWTDYNYVKEFRCSAEFGSASSPDCPAAYVANPNSTRPFLMSYPSLIKGRVGLTERIGAFTSIFVNVDNIGDNENYELNNINPIFGRITTFGLRFQY